MLIIKNAIRCNLFGNEIESLHEYLRLCYLEDGCFTDISICVPDTQSEENT